VIDERKTLIGVPKAADGEAAERRLSILSEAHDFPCGRLAVAFENI